MAIVLDQLYEELKSIRTYLIKIGPGRRQGNILEIKLNEANSIFKTYSSWLLDFKNDLSKGKIQSADKLLYENACKKFESLHSEILSLCCPESVESDTKMASFDLKTALNLLPVMNNDESSIKQLIDNIIYYDSILSSTDCKKSLIQFVLKSRLSQAAKLRLRENYASINALVTDMKIQLLPTKGATAIQKRLHNSRQNDMSVSDFGKEITELFVDLTIAQAEGNTDSYKVLKSVNEKMAIKQFSEGLRNRRLSTIISARNFSSLKDAVQSAEDEEIASPSTSGEVMGMHKQNFYNSRDFHKNSGYFHGEQNRRAPSYRGRHHFISYRGRNNKFRGHSQRGWTTAQPNLSFSRGKGQRGRNNQGKFNRPYGGNRGIGRNSVNVIHENKNLSSESEPRLDQFFRE